MQEKRVSHAARSRFQLGCSAIAQNAVQAGNHTEALRIRKALLTFWKTISADNLPACVKFALTLQGCPAGLPRMPMPAPSAEQKARIEAALPGALVYDTEGLRTAAE